MGYLVNESPLVKIQYTILNADLINIQSGVDINVNAANGKPFAIAAAALHYINATTDFSLTAGGVSAVLNYRTGGDVACVYQDTLSGTGHLKILPGNCVSFLCNYDPTAPNFAPQFSDSEINIAFDGDYQSGDGDLVVTILGYYL